MYKRIKLLGLFFLASAFQLNYCQDQIGIQTGSKISAEKCGKFFMDDFFSRIKGLGSWAKNFISLYGNEGLSFLEMYLQDTFSSWSCLENDQKHMILVVMGLASGGILYQAGFFNLPAKILKKVLVLSFGVSAIATAVYVHGQDPKFFSHTSFTKLF